MATEASANAHSWFLPRSELQSLIDLLIGRGFQVIAPTVDEQAIVYGPITSVDELPQGWTDVQEAGTYRLVRRDDEALFGYVVGPHSWKRYFFSPLATVAAADRTADGWTMSTPPDPAPRYALLGVRACELAAMAIQDRVFLGGAWTDPIYALRRRQALVIAVECTQAASTCFCASMGTGPKCSAGFDLALTEIAGGFTVAVGSDAGAELAKDLPLSKANAEHVAAATIARQAAADQIKRRLDTKDIHDLLLKNLEHPQWDDVAARCLSCTNCTLVCPTCFCATVDEVADLAGDHVERRRRWDSCFNIDFSYMNGGPVRDQIRTRYRQWLTHKLASWIDQFGTSGCVGCGRCITWCPVGIDLTREVAAIRGEIP